MNILGIDPGFSGAMCLLNQDRTVFSPKRFSRIGDEFDINEMRETISKWVLEDGIHHVFIEHVHAMFRQSAKSTFNYGTVFGMQRAVVTCLNLPYTLVAPKKWQEDMHDGAMKRDPSKQRSRVVAERIFPMFTDVLKHDGVIDAALIAEYGLRKIKG